MEQTLKKVTFRLHPMAGFSPDEDEMNEMQELARTRKGWFHGRTEVYDKDHDMKTLLFVIEDEETGVVHKVDPELVKFEK